MTIVGSMSDALKPSGTGLGMTSSDIGMAGAIYVAGACLGSLFFGQLTDRFGRKKLFLVTLGVYLVGTVLTALSMNPMWYFAARFITGAGVGGEYAAINSAIDELIPAKYRGRVDLAINGSFWLGAAAGSMLTVALLNPDLVPAAGLAARLRAGRHPAASGSSSSAGTCPRARAGCSSTAARRRASRSSARSSTPSARRPVTTCPRCPRASPSASARASASRMIARTVFTLYPKRTVLCFPLFVGQAFLYNAFFFTYGDTLSTFLGVKQTGWFLAAFAVSNFVGALTLGPLFDTHRPGQDDRRHLHPQRDPAGRHGTRARLVTAVTLTIAGAVVFFFASAGASAAYLTASEVFPMETRALCIAFFYAIGTAAGGISGPLLFGSLIDNASASKDITQIASGYYIGAALMIIGGLAEVFLGVKAEGQAWRTSPSR